MSDIPEIPSGAIINGSPSPSKEGVAIDFQDVVDELRSEISDLSYQNMLLRLTVKQLQQR
jgi:hypothetical protein